MKIWIARHGQTDLNQKRRMQGLTDCPLNEKGIRQAHQSRKNIGGVRFDAVYASPLQRARLTGSIIGGVDLTEVIVDDRLVEVDFGRYEQRKYYLMGPAMAAYWAFPRRFPAPPTVENLDSMRDRAASFLRDLERKDYDNVLVACHGGIMRALCGRLEEAPDGLYWKRAANCEIRVYEYKNGKHRFLKSYSLPKSFCS
ncbi:MAG: histidine phosphatase family protein [Lachnospiraceae bacterium]|nr:histidine phosphatase family protein [Lachnospiraceae bacterium]